MKLTLLSRTYCHLCDEMQAAFLSWKAASENTARSSKIGDLQVIDVDEFADLEALWGDKVPVLLLDDVEVCHYHFDAEKMIAALDRSAENGVPHSRNTDTLGT
jgi:hypothetical protein